LSLGKCARHHLGPGIRTRGVVAPHQGMRTFFPIRQKSICEGHPDMR
jgi:hypothetical protein